MEIIRLFDQSHFDNDVIGTEKHCIDLLKNESVYSPSVILADHLFAQQINVEGLASAQASIDLYCEQFNGRQIIFVCHHIAVSRLDWRNSVVFSPHACYGCSAKPLAHYAVNAGQPFLDAFSRCYFGSFLGAYSTHPCRQLLSIAFSGFNGYYFEDTGHWHFQYTESEQTERRRIYKSSLENSIFSFSPRGTGPSTIRIWESLASGAIPIIISDTLYLPYPFNLMLPVYSPSEVSCLPAILDQHLTLEMSMLDAHRVNLVKSYYKYCGNDRLHLPVLQFLKS